MDPQVRHEITEADDGTRVMQMMQVKLAQKLNSAVSQALTQQM